jgi:hypothetical protein
LVIAKQTTIHVTNTLTSEPRSIKCAPVDDGATQQVAAAATPAPAVSASATEQTPASTNDTGDAAVSVCARIFEDVAEFAKMERDAANPDRASAPGDEQLLAEWENLQRNLAGSRDPELFLTAFLLGRRATLMSRLVVALSRRCDS